MSTTQATRLNSPEWLFFVKASFATAICAMVSGIVLLPVDMTTKSFFGMGTLFLVGSCFTLSKTMRDEFENHKLVNRLADAKAEQILKEYGDV
ncbi:MAG: YiaA/YiaB family inner membrane protein [Hyphomicrobiaceae bacterium]